MRGLERGALVLSVMSGSLATPAVAEAAGTLNLNPTPWITVLNIGVFVLLIYPTNRWLLQPLMKVLRDRVAAVEGAAARASDIRGEAATQRSELEERLAAARVAAQSERLRIMGEVQAEERQVLDAARREGGASIEEVRRALSEELVSARSALADAARSLAQEAASKILGRPL